MAMDFTTRLTPEAVTDGEAWKAWINFSPWSQSASLNLPDHSVSIDRSDDTSTLQSPRSALTASNAVCGHRHTQESTNGGFGSPAGVDDTTLGREFELHAPNGPSDEHQGAKRLTDKDWVPFKETIKDLYVNHNLPLSVVRDILDQDHGFSAPLYKYKRKLKAWGLNSKNVKHEEMLAAVRKLQHRRLKEPEKQFVPKLRGESIAMNVHRYIKRRKIAEDEPFVATTDAATPEALEVLTMSPSGSHIPSRDPTLSPAFSQSSLFLPKPSAFRGQSPVPSNRNEPEQLHFGQGSTQTLASRHRFRYEIHEEQAWRELKHRESVFGQGHANTLDALMSYGNTLMNSGRYRKAEEIFRKMLAYCRALGDSKDPRILDAQHGLGEVFLQQGMSNKAQNLLEKNLVSRREVLKYNDPRLLESLLMLAQCQNVQGNPRETERLCRDVLIGAQDIGLSKGHHITRYAMFELGAVLCALGEYLESETVLREVVELGHGILGLEDPEVFMYMRMLARTVKAQGRMKDALPMLRGCFAALTKLLGDEHPWALSSARDLAVCLSEQGGNEEAEMLFKKVVLGSIRVLGSEHPNTLSAQEAWARSLNAQNKFAEAETLMKGHIEISRRVFGPEHLRTKEAIRILGASLEGQGRFLEAAQVRYQG